MDGVSRDAVDIRVKSQLPFINITVKATAQFKIEIGKLDYGYGIQGIVGFDLLRSLNAILDLEKLELR